MHSDTTAEEWLATKLSAYPTALGWRAKASPLVTSSIGGHTTEPWWVPATLSRQIEQSEWAQSAGILDALAPIDPVGGYRMLRPAIDAAQTDAPPSPLMTWWALLFGLSMLARYQPATWAELLAVDRNEWAVSIEFALESAAASIPALVANSLYQY